MEAQAETLARYLLKERCSELNNCGDVSILEAALSLCHRYGFQAESVRFTNRLLDKGYRKVSSTPEVSSPLVMALLGFFALSKDQLNRDHLPRRFRDLIPRVREWHSQQLLLLQNQNPPALHGFVGNLHCRAHLIHWSGFPEIRGDEFTVDFVKSGLFQTPLLIQNPASAGFTIVSDFGCGRILQDIGSNFPVNVIDVQTQQERDQRGLGDFMSYYNTPREQRMETLNLISLNVSNTAKGPGLFQAPRSIRALDWAVQFGIPKRQRVTHYILLSPATSFTDFHFDLSGSSAWLYVHSGKKIFYFIEPNEDNLRLYQRWQKSEGRGRVFFPSLVNGCHQVLITSGQLLLIPGGWIHGVATPEDSIAVGGNFLHSFNIAMQIRCQIIELDGETSTTFLFPMFRDLHLKVLKSYRRGIEASQILTEQEEQEMRLIASFVGEV